MKHHIVSGLKDLTKHRRLLWLLICMVLVAVGVIIYISTTIHASEIVIFTHYSAFGVTHIYRDSWVYLLSFIFFIVIATVFAAIICVKLLRQEREPLALTYGWLTIGMIALALLIYIRLAYSIN